ncbi:MAG: flippase-like domain-containing protein [Chitinophagaceae bacterium]|nr:flippase-like domain-containing protein [Chitinophagaceae bacterium]
MDASPPAPQSTAIKILKLLLKLGISVLCLWYVSGKINWKDAKDALQSANVGWMALAALAFVLSKVFSSVRLLIYFRDIGVPLSQTSNLHLYWLGMFYNLFLPGAISGDAYKVILLKKWFETPYKKSGAAVLLDRLSGVIALGLLLALYSWFVFEPLWIPGILTVGAVAGILVLQFIINRWMRDFKKSYLSTLLWGLAVQGMQVVCVYCIMAGFGLDISVSAYIFLFPFIVSCCGIATYSWRTGNT